MPVQNCEVKVWWVCVSPEDKSPGTVVINWPDDGKTVRCLEETLREGKNVWYSEKEDRTFSRSTDEHTVLCDLLLNNEIARRDVKQNPRINLVNIKNLIFSN